MISDFSLYELCIRKINSALLVCIGKRRGHLVLLYIFPAAKSAFTWLCYKISVSPSVNQNDFTASQKPGPPCLNWSLPLPRLESIFNALPISTVPVSCQAPNLSSAQNKAQILSPLLSLP